MVVMVLSIVLTIALVTWQSRVAAATGSRVVAADRLHYLGDLIPNVGALVSLWASAQFGLSVIDGIVGLAASVMLAVGALKIGTGAWNALMDRAVEPEIVAEIERIAGSAAGIAGFHDLKTRRAGSRFFVNLHVEIDGRLPLEDAHEIAAEVVRAILRTFPKADVIIHMDPVRDGTRTT
jgi:ferrous-iron efflux pump FieF